MNIDHTFYENIAPIQRISDIARLEHYHDVPADWHIVIVDVKGSTKAVQAGKYKQVNAIAAASITAMLNLIPQHDVPFVFGGDGATILIPPALVEAARGALRATRQMAAEQFDLELWSGIIPVRQVLELGYPIRVARLQMSENFQQAIFTGGGLAYAERLLKDPEHGAQYAISDEGDAHADFTGFQCRWDEIESPSEEVLSLIVRALGDDIKMHHQVYDDVLRHIDSLYGDYSRRHPVRATNIHIARNPRMYHTEARIQHGDTRLHHVLPMFLITMLGNLMIRLGVARWGRYKHIAAAATDSEKFDDTLRMIIAGTAQQREQLRAFLEQKRQEGLIVYGTHSGRYALMTCIVFNPFGRQVHFVDGGEGGYTLAAAEMKAQLKALTAK